MKFPDLGWTTSTAHRPTPTRHFSLDGRAYRIDLSESNSAKLTEALAPFIEHARPKSGERGAAPTAQAGDFDIAELRSWAAANGIALPAPGRIPGAVIEQYRSARGEDGRISGVGQEVPLP